MRPLLIQALSSVIVIGGVLAPGGSRAQSWLVSIDRWRLARTRRLFSPHGSTHSVSPPWRRTSRSPSWLRYCLLIPWYLPAKPDRQQDQTRREKVCPRWGSPADRGP